MALNRSPEFCLKLTYRYMLKADHVHHDTLGVAMFGPQDNNLNNLSRGPLGVATYQTSTLYALWFQKRFFHVFPIEAYVKHVTHEARSFLDKGI